MTFVSEMFWTFHLKSFQRSRSDLRFYRPCARKVLLHHKIYEPIRIQYANEENDVHRIWVSWHFLFLISFSFFSENFLIWHLMESLSALFFGICGCVLFLYFLFLFTYSVFVCVQLFTNCSFYFILVSWILLHCFII